jgi:penicillin G amidase
LNNQYDGLRAGRIEQLLQRHLADGPLDVADMRQIQSDVGLIDAQVLVPHLISAFDRAKRAADPRVRALGRRAAVKEAVRRLRRWDHTTPTGVRRGYDAADTGADLAQDAPSAAERRRSVSASIYAAWRSQLVRDTVDATLADFGVPPPGGDMALADLRTLLEDRPQPGVGASGIDFFAVPGVTNHATARDIVLLHSLGRALDALAGPSYASAFGRSPHQRDYRWGRLHRSVFASPLGTEFSLPRESGPLRPSIPGLSGFSVDGGYGTIDAAYHDLRATKPADYMFKDGPARRFIGEITATGTSGRHALAGDIDNSRQPERTDLLVSYLVNDYHRFLQPPRARQ